MSVLALRPAPIQMSFKNFVGTLGARDHVAWLLTDRVASPPELSNLFAERFVYMPGSFYVAGHHLMSNDAGGMRNRFLPGVFVC